MAPRKKKEEIDINDTITELTSIDEVLASIKDKYGDIAQTGDNIQNEKQEIISFSPSIDVGLGGGIPFGSIVTISGPAKGGKTTSILNFCKNAQSCGATIVYFDVEYRLKEMNLSSTYGLDMSKFIVIRSTKEEPLSAEKQCNMMVELLQSVDKLIIVVDSFSMMRTEAHMARDSVVANARDDIQKLISFFIKRIIDTVKIRRCVLIGVNHVYANVSGYGASSLESCPSKLMYARDVALRLKKKDKWEAGGKHIGDSIIYVVDVAALPHSPGTEAISMHRFGKGIDELAELINIGSDLGLITGSTWMKADFMSSHVEEFEEAKYKAQGREKFYHLLKENPDWITLLQKDVKDLLFAPSA